MANLLVDTERELPVSEAQSSQYPLLGEHDGEHNDGQHLRNYIPRNEQTDSITSENSSHIINENAYGNDMETLHASRENDSVLYERGDRSIGDANMSHKNFIAQLPLTRDVDEMTSSDSDEILPTLLPCLDAHTIESLVAWSLELLALFISMCSFAAIVVLLARYDGQIQPSFTDVISINTLIAIFSTIMRATLLFIVCEVIGELKWDWVENPRPLREIEYFINASTSVVGSMKFLTFSWRPIMTIAGSLVVIASSAIGPFSQQSSATYSCSEPMRGTASINIAHNISDRMTSEMRGAAVNGLLYGSAGSSLTKSNLFSCPSESCTFKVINGTTHASVGVCSSCVPAGSSPLEDELQVLRMRTVFDSVPKPEGFRKEKRPQLVADILRGKNMTISLRVFTHTGLSKGVQSYSKHLRIIDAVVVDCVIYPCLRAYNGQIVNGTLNETVVSQVPLPFASQSGSEEGGTVDEFYGDFVDMIEPCFLNGHLYSASNISEALNVTEWTSISLDGKLTKLPAKCLAIIGFNAYGSIQYFVNNTIAGSCNVSSLDDFFNNTELVDCGDKLWLDGLLKGGKATFSTISGAFDGMTTAISNLMRSADSELFRSSSISETSGSSSQPAVCIKAYWAWLLYPGTCLLVTMVLLVTACGQSLLTKRQRPIWKSSILPLLLYGIKLERTSSVDQNVEISAEVPLLKLKELKTVADHTIVRFNSEAGAPGFVTEEGERGLKSTVFKLKQGGIYAVRESRLLKLSRHAEEPGIVGGTTRLRKRRMTDEAIGD